MRSAPHALCVLDLGSSTGQECLLGINLWALRNNGIVRELCEVTSQSTWHSDAEFQIFVWNLCDQEETLKRIGNALVNGVRRFIGPSDDSVLEAMAIRWPEEVRASVFVAPDAFLAPGGVVQSLRCTGALPLLRLGPSPEIIAKHISATLASIASKACRSGRDVPIRVYAIHADGGSSWEMQAAEAVRAQCMLRDADGKNVADMFEGENIHVASFEALARRLEERPDMNYIVVVCGSDPVDRLPHRSNVYYMLGQHAYADHDEPDENTIRTGCAPDNVVKMLEFTKTHRMYFGTLPTWSTALGHDACCVLFDTGHQGVTGSLTFGCAGTPISQDRRSGRIVSTMFANVYEDVRHEVEVVVSDYEGFNVNTAFSSSFGVHFESKQADVEGKNYIPRGGKGRLLLTQKIKRDVKVSVRNMMGRNAHFTVPDINNVDIKVFDSQSLHVANDMLMQQQMHKCAPVIHSWKEEFAYEQVSAKPDPENPSEVKLTDVVVSTAGRMFPGTFFATSNTLQSELVTHIKVVIPDLGIPNALIHQAAFHHIDMMATDTASLAGTNVVVIVSPELLLTEEGFHDPEAPENTLYGLVQHLRFVYHHPGRQIDLHLGDRALDLFKHYAKKYTFAQYGQIFHFTTTGLKQQGVMTPDEATHFVVDQIDVSGYYARLWLGPQLCFAPDAVRAELLKPVDDPLQFLASPTSRSSYVNMLRAVLACSRRSNISLDLRGLTGVLAEADPEIKSRGGNRPTKSRTSKPRAAFDSRSDHSELWRVRVNALCDSKPLFCAVESVHKRHVFEIALENVLPTDGFPLPKPGRRGGQVQVLPKQWDCLEAARQSSYVQTNDDAYCVIEPSIGRVHQSYSVRSSPCLARHHLPTYDTFVCAKQPFENSEVRFWSAVANFVSNDVVDFLDQVAPEPIKQFVAVIVDGVEILVEVAAPIVDAVAEFVEEARNDVVNFVEKAIPAVIGAIGDVVGDVVDFAASTITAIATTIADVVTSIGDFFVDLAQTVANVWNLLTDGSTYVSIVTLLVWLVRSTLIDNRSLVIPPVSLGPDGQEVSLPAVEFGWSGLVAFMEELVQSIFSFDFLVGIVKAVGESLTGKGLTQIAKNIIAVKPMTAPIIIPIMTFLNMIMNGQSFIISFMRTLISLYTDGFTKEVLGIVVMMMDMIMKRVTTSCDKSEPGATVRCNSFTRFVAKLVTGGYNPEALLKGGFASFRNALRSMEAGPFKQVFQVIPLVTPGPDSAAKEQQMRDDMQLEAPTFTQSVRKEGGIRIDLSFDLGVSIKTVVGAGTLFLQQKVAEWIIKKIFEYLCRIMLRNPAFQNSPILKNVLCGKMIMKRQKKLEMKLRKEERTRKVHTSNTEVLNPLNRARPQRRVVTTRSVTTIPLEEL
jgi:hypothetical protein